MDKIVQTVAFLLLVAGVGVFGFLFYKKSRHTTAPSTSTIASSQQQAEPSAMEAKESAPVRPLDPNIAEALNKIQRINPNQLTELPGELRYVLNREKCAVVQQGNHALWMKGSFYKKNQTDYAALCITPNNELTIKVTWGDEHPCPISLAYGLADRYVTFSSESGHNFARFIAKADPQRMRNEALQNKITPPKTMPDGIEDGIQGRQSTIYFCNGKEWVKIPATTNASH